MKTYGEVLYSPNLSELYAEYEELLEDIYYRLKDIDTNKPIPEYTINLCKQLLVIRKQIEHKLEYA